MKYNKFEDETWNIITKFIEERKEILANNRSKYAELKLKLNNEYEK